MSVINSFIAQLKLSAQPEVGATEQIPNITDTQVFLRTVGNVPNDITGVTFYVSSAVPSNATISINDSIPLPLGSSIGFGYAPGNTTALEDLISGLVTNPSLVASAGSIITVDVTYYARDMSPVTGGPTLSLASASVEDANPDQIVLTFSSALDGASVPATTDFTVSGGKTVNNVAIAGSAITLTVDSAYINSDTITVSHTPGGNPITGTNTATAGAFSNFAVTNNIAGVTDTTAPTAVLVGVLPTATTGVAATVTVDFDDETSFNPSSVTVASLSAIDGASVATIAISNTTAIGNNGVRVDFDVTAPVDGSYTVTVPVNSYADTAGNQGSLVNLGTMTASGAADTTAPTAVLVGVLPTATTGIAATVTIDFDDETAFNPASVTIGSLSAVDGANVATIAIASTTAIGNNGVRVDFDVTAPVDGSYTVTVPVNSYADTAGNQGSLVNLGTMTASAASAGGDLVSLTSSDVFHNTLIGQSNAVYLGTSRFETSFAAAYQGTVNSTLAATSGTGFQGGIGAWNIDDPNVTNLISGLNASKGTTTHYGPIVVWMGETDGTNVAYGPGFADQLINLDFYVQRETGLQLNWLVIRLNNSSGIVAAAEIISQTDAFIASDSRFHLMAIDDFTLDADGYHYLTTQFSGQPTYDAANDRVISLINSNNLVLTAASAAVAPPPIVTGGGVVFESTFTGAAGASITTATHTTGTITPVQGEIVIGASGSGLTAAGVPQADPDRWLFLINEIPVGEVIEVDFICFSTNSGAIHGPIFRRNANGSYYNLQVKHIEAQLSTAWHRSTQPGIAVFNITPGTLAGDNIYTGKLQYSANEIRWQINSEPVVALFHNGNPLDKQVGFRIRGAGSAISELRYAKVTGLTAFTL